VGDAVALHPKPLEPDQRGEQERDGEPYLRQTAAAEIVIAGDEMADLEHDRSTVNRIAASSTTLAGT
jgi:hypothetical protein